MGVGVEFRRVGFGSAGGDDGGGILGGGIGGAVDRGVDDRGVVGAVDRDGERLADARSEERRVGKVSIGLVVAGLERDEGGVGGEAVAAVGVEVDGAVGAGDVVGGGQG